MGAIRSGRCVLALAPDKAGTELAHDRPVAPDVRLEDEATHAVVEHAVGAGVKMVVAHAAASVAIRETLGRARTAMKAPWLAGFEKILQGFVIAKGPLGRHALLSWNDTSPHQQSAVYIVRAVHPILAVLFRLTKPLASTIIMGR